MTSGKNSKRLLANSAVDKIVHSQASIAEQIAMGQGLTAADQLREMARAHSLSLSQSGVLDSLNSFQAASRSDVITTALMGLNRNSAAEMAIEGIQSKVASLHEFDQLRVWQMQLCGLTSAARGTIARQQTEIEKALARISGGLSFGSAELGLSRPDLGAHVRKALEDFSSLDLTYKRFSAIAGISEYYGAGELHRQSVTTLLGEWQTRTDLPEQYWKDLEYRRSLYREADVDEGLIEADPDTAVALGVSSGAIIGEIIEEGCYVVGQTASGLLTLQSSCLETDVFELVGTVEASLWSLIAAKMSVLSGDNWFKHHVPSALYRKARETRHKALKAGENSSPLIEFLTLGEMMEIVLRNDNWEKVFEPIFRNRDWFKRDIEVIAVARNPNAHYRANDSLRLTEALIVWQRLSSYIADDGQWLNESAAEI